jgi:hypothetical protein
MQTSSTQAECVPGSQINTRVSPLAPLSASGWTYTPALLSTGLGPNEASSNFQPSSSPHSSSERLDTAGERNFEADENTLKAVAQTLV